MLKKGLKIMFYIKTTRSFSEEHIELSTRTYAQDEFQTLAIRFIYGAEIMSKTYSKPQKEWRYDKVASLPNSYVKANAYTPDKAIAYGEKLINAVYTQNRKTVNKHLRTAQKELYRIFMDNAITVYLPNSAIALEANAEDLYEEDLRTLQEYDSKFWDDTAHKIVSCEAKRTYTDEELSFYCRAFQVSAPQWFISQYNRKCQGKAKDGHSYSIWAECPIVTSKAKASYASNYAGNLNADGSQNEMAPLPLLKDATPKALAIEQRQLLVDSVDYFLNLPAEDMQDFLADTFRIVDNQIVELSPEDIEAEELATIRETYKKLWAI